MAETRIGMKIKLEDLIEVKEVEAKKEDKSSKKAKKEDKSSK